MPAQVLSLASAFNSGSDLWVVPERKYSTLARQLDWLLNFQIAKTSQHQSLEISENIRTVLNQTELTSTEFKNVEQDCLMIASRHLVPAQWILVIKGSDELPTWVNHIFEKWRGLAYPSLRVFLPQGADTHRFESLWLSAGGTDQLSLVVDANG